MSYGYGAGYDAAYGGSTAAAARNYYNSGYGNQSSAAASYRNDIYVKNMFLMRLLKVNSWGPKFD